MVISFCPRPKTGSVVNIPATDILTARPNKMYAGSNKNPDAPIIVCETTGKPYSERLYRKHASKIRKLAGLPEELKLSDPTQWRQSIR